MPVGVAGFFGETRREGFGTDRMIFRDDELSYALGHQIRAERKLGHLKLGATAGTHATPHLPD